MERLIGLRVNKITNKGNYDFDPEYNSDIITEYEFITKENGVFYSYKLAIENGLCYSGYTTAQWLHSKKSELYERGSIHYAPKDKNLKFDIQRVEGYFKIYDNYDSYYPTAEIDINFENWIDTKRSKIKKPLYVFTGDSGLGKSFIANHTDLKVFETDGVLSVYMEAPEFYKEYDIIVMGNKNGETLDDLVSYLESDKITEEIEIISVNFNEVS
jgi:hypothetical protein